MNVIISNEATNKRHSQGFISRVSMSAQNWQFLFFIFRIFEEFLQWKQFYVSHTHTIYGIVSSVSWYPISKQSEFRKLIFNSIRSQFRSSNRNNLLSTRFIAIKWLGFLSTEFQNLEPCIFVAFISVLMKYHHFWSAIKWSKLFYSLKITARAQIDIETHKSCWPVKMVLIRYSEWQENQIRLRWFLKIYVYNVCVCTVHCAVCIISTVKLFPKK